MKNLHFLDKIDFQLLRTLHTLLTERSVSKAALRLGQHQPAVSTALKRLRELTGDPLLVRAGGQMVGTDMGLRLIDPVADILQRSHDLFTQARSFDPHTTTETFRIAAGDSLDPLFLPAVLARVKQQAPHCKLEFLPLSAQAQYASDLAQGNVDVVIGNWLRPRDELHSSRLFEDQIVSLLSSAHPAVRRGWSVQDWLDCEHVAPTSAYPGWRGIIDEHLDHYGLQRRITTRSAHFGLIPNMVASSLLVLTTGRHYCQRYLDGHGGSLKLRVLTCPIKFPPMVYSQLWHERSHHASANKWLREQIKLSAQGLLTDFTKVATT